LMVDTGVITAERTHPDDGYVNAVLGFQFLRLVSAIFLSKAI